MRGNRLIYEWKGGSFYVSVKLRTYPSAKPTLTLSSYLRQNVGLGEGSVGSSRCASKKEKDAGEERRKCRFLPRPTHYCKPLFILSFKYLPRWPSVTLGNKTPYWRATHAPPTNVYLRCNDEDDKENVKKAISLISKTTTSHVHQSFLYISFPFLHDYDVKMPNFAFYGGRRQATTIYFSFWAWIWSLENSTSGGFAYNWQSG